MHDMVEPEWDDHNFDDSTELAMAAGSRRMKRGSRADAVARQPQAFELKRRKPSGEQPEQFPGCGRRDANMHTKRDGGGLTRLACWS